MSESLGLVKRKSNEYCGSSCIDSRKQSIYNYSLHLILENTEVKAKHIEEMAPSGKTPAREKMKARIVRILRFHFMLCLASAFKGGATISTRHRDCS
jgi:hypothetical protein